jgi:hypothetical protein
MPADFFSILLDEWPWLTFMLCLDLRFPSVSERSLS